MRRPASRGVRCDHAAKTAVRRFPWFLTSPQYREWLLGMMEWGYCTELSEDELLDSLTQDTRLHAIDIEDIRHSILSSIEHISRCSGLLHPQGWFRSFISFAEYLPATVLITLPDDDHTLVYANRYIEEMLGYSSMELVGSCCPLLLPKKSDDKTAIQKLQNAIKCSQPISLALTCRSKNDNLVHCHILSKPMYDIMCNYRFVVSIISNDLRQEKIHVLGQFLSITPNVIFESK